ncbi:hypothetical protein EP867_17500 [Falsigemmobacter intermedius]|uniref:Uncharacterized protein n=2 Tax=Falsigemmobacter intermedius TaxID=1553448 RepID=A0A3S3UMU7_9RHOB|nr:hypothetical protein [Falsigemmobacter intermedius]RWY37328.1 hypothetical protein EP867_17500 [Falsigemmobacter intermedius]
MRSVDATPEELRQAIGREDLSPEQVAQAFCRLFTRENVKNFFPPDASSRDGPRALRALRFFILTCHITATSHGAGTTQNFRVRLGQLLDEGDPEHGVSGVNEMWRALASVIDRKRQQGEPWRRIVLPDPGREKLIGIALRLAKPSWADRRALRAVMQKFPERTFEDRFTLLDAVCARRADLPLWLQSEVKKLHDSYRAAPASLFGNATWQLISSIASDMLKSGDKRLAPLWQLTALFSGWDGDQVDLQLARGMRESDLAKPVWTRDIGTPNLNRYMAVDSRVQALWNSDAVLFQQAGGASWTVGHRPPREDLPTLLLTRLPRILSGCRTRPVGGGWHATRPMSLQEARALRDPRAMVPNAADSAQPPLRLEGGIRLSDGYLLGRPGYFPTVHLSDSLPPRVATRGEQEQQHLTFEATAVDGVFKIVSSKPIHGIWTLSRNKQSDELPLRLMSRSTIIEDWPDRADTARELKEMQAEVTQPAATLRFEVATVRDCKGSESPLTHALEALYCRGKAARSEGEVVDLLSRVLPEPRTVWDVLRSLEEARWLVRDVNRTWRGRKWRLLPPQIIATSETTAMCEGAWGEAALEKLDALSTERGIRVTQIRSDPWSAPLVQLEGRGLERLAAIGKWAFEKAPDQMPLTAAPDCWLRDRREGIGHKVVGRWSAKHGHFLPAEAAPAVNGPVLERLVRDDDQDIYRLTGAGADLLLESRVAAILEHHRRSRIALFQLNGEGLERICQDGHLPLDLAIFLRRGHAAQTGPILRTDGTWTYHYPVSTTDFVALCHVYGPALSGSGRSQGRMGRTVMHSLGDARRRGLRPNMLSRGH